jgi:branched-chain amino acid transport system substrate-binding protein
MSGRRTPIFVLCTVAVVVGALVSLTVASTAGAARSVRGFDGNTITVAGIGNLAQSSGTPVGVKARIKEFNDAQEIKGIKLSYAEFADDKGDPATALSETRRLVTEDQVFAIVGDASANNPGDYLKQQHVPYFGWAFDNTYCSNTIDKTIYGFGFNGCLVPDNPKVMPDIGFALYDYVKKQAGKQHPTMALFSGDMQAGKNTAKNQASAFQGVGFDVVYAKGVLPQTVGDYTPFAQAVLHADNGKAPDVITCAATIDCIPMYQLVKANGFTGTFSSALYSDVLIKSMAGSTAFIFTENLTAKTPALDQLRASVEAVKPGAAVDSGTAAGYTATDMFIQALKTIAKKGKANITPETLQAAAMNQTWKMPGLAGPTKYPQSVVAPTPYCLGLVLSDGTAWNTVEPFTCSAKRFPVLNKFQG